MVQFLQSSLKGLVFYISKSIFIKTIPSINKWIMDINSSHKYVTELFNNLHFLSYVRSIHFSFTGGD